MAFQLRNENEVKLNSLLLKFNLEFLVKFEMVPERISLRNGRNHYYYCKLNASSSSTTTFKNKVVQFHFLSQSHSARAVALSLYTKVLCSFLSLPLR